MKNNNSRIIKTKNDRKETIKLSNVLYKKSFHSSEEHISGCWKFIQCMVKEIDDY